ncbi:arylsulfatase [Sediminicoccus rosea]|uniref:Arylsulfatase n=1 Tax=Sediminicoccus rosea TaxID=1225128 RepID=A0ABZ0PPC7_9PROT|nr:arylsulfatase [Sediminicoccus rosea]WPB87311.1 arylsulfatase [Sediminicoccus rosea]
MTDSIRPSRRNMLLGGAAGLAATAAQGVQFAQAQAQAQPAAPGRPAAAPQGRPNILVIFGDDVGWSNISAYNMGMMGYRTPNIDRIAREGAMFTDAYAENSCTAGRSAFITGQSPVRTGLSKVGLPGAAEGMRAEDPTIAVLLKAMGYATGQFGKNHLGDRDEHLPTMHGFDEFFGSLYHLNAEDEPENPDYPRNPEFRRQYAPRGVLKSWANADGTQRIENTGPLTMKRMETVDEEFLAGALDFMDRSHRANRPFFTWFNSTRMHIWTRLKESSRSVTGLGVYPDGMVEHDGHVGQLLKKLDDLGITQNTIVLYTTDNGAEVMSWPDGGCTPFRGEKATAWEGGFRVPMAVRWPGRIPAGQVINDIFSHQDWLPTLLAAAGDPDIKPKLLAGHQVGRRSYKVHLDGYNQLPLLTGSGPGARREMFYFTDDGDLAALRYDQWKIHFLIQENHGLRVWERNFTTLRMPMLFNLRSDPFERADESFDYGRWRVERAFAFVPAQQFVGQFLATFRDFPPRQAPGSFSLGDAMSRLRTGAAGR